MCRLLAVTSPSPIDIREHLRLFAHISKTSREYQGHGWGCSRLLLDGAWSHYHNIRPVWEDDLSPFEPTSLLLAHARSAFRDEGIVVENNMPFDQGGDVFIFNGELHGVKIREEGRIGAEKIFRFIERFNHAPGELGAALRKGVDIIVGRTRQVKAMNIIMSDGREVHVSSTFTERPEYFTMHWRQGASLQAAGNGPGITICSDPLPGIGGWTPIGNGEFLRFA